MRNPAPPSKQLATHSTARQLPLPIRWRQAWDSSLRFRLLSLGLMPLLVAFPFLIAILVLVGGERANSLLISNLRSHLAGSQNYLNQLKTDTGVRVRQLANSERLIHLIDKNSNHSELNRVLSTAAQGSGLDFLIVATSNGTIIGSNTGVAPNSQLPDSYIIRQALIGVANAAYERFDVEQLSAFSPQFRDEARVVSTPGPNSPSKTETRGLLINAAAHLPLAVNSPDAILVGGILLNKNLSLIEHMREIIFPVGTLPGNAEGQTSIYLDDVSVAISRQRQQGQRAIGTLAPANVAAIVMGQGVPWLGKHQFSGDSYIAGYEPLIDGDGHRIGMIGVGFPDEPYQKAALLLLGMVAGLLALTMLAISIVFLRTGRELTLRLAVIGDTMSAVRLGDREARVGAPLREDELGRLARHFDVLLDTIATQDAMQQAAQQTIADEASRRRALFEKERDGVVILNPDGSVFEANPKCAAMLGYSPEELQRLHVRDWDAQLSQTELNVILTTEGAEGTLFETVQRRKDGSTYAAEVSLSRAEWGDKTFVFVLQRDISERKAAESELAKYRQKLEKLVDQRTKELNDRSEQLNTIFTLSPDGFVSFDKNFKVTFANRAFLRMTGMETPDIIGLDEMTFSERLAKRCLANATFPGVATLRMARKKISTADVDAEQGNGRRQLFELAAPANRVLEVGIRMSETESVSQILYFRDVTHETEVDRMKSEFLSTAAHELRTPMASIYGYAELLQMKEFEAADRKDMLATISRQSERMVSIINELLDLARIEARRGKDFKIERLSLQDIVAESVAGYKPPDGRHPPLIAPSDAALFVNADRKKMQQVVLNIMSNAYKYSPDGGDVSVVFRKNDGDGPRRVGIELRDSGIGMNAGQKSRVFERFYRADTSGKIPGTGLGMSIVKEIIELHGGEVSLVSQIDVGTTVTLWLPAA